MTLHHYRALVKDLQKACARRAYNNRRLQAKIERLHRENNALRGKLEHARNERDALIAKDHPSEQYADDLPF